MTPRVLVSLVTCNEEGYLRACLHSLFEQTVAPDIRIFDNGSQDATVGIAREEGVWLHESQDNLGYSAGHNFNLSRGGFEAALLANADVILDPHYLEYLLEAVVQVEGVGLAGGKLFRMGPGGERMESEEGPILDSTGIYFTPTQRHFDRGSSQPDVGQFDRRETVFGITGAALLVTREFYEDMRAVDEFLDEDFFAYREDADLAWRAQLRGWRAVYEPRATGRHARKVLPERRREVSSLINYHSVKNRFLMRKKNIDVAVRLRCFPFMWIRDLAILFYLLLVERSSLAALGEVFRLRRRFKEKRRRIQQSRKTSPSEMARWFSFRPRAGVRPAPSGPAGS